MPITKWINVISQVKEDKNSSSQEAKTNFDYIVIFNKNIWRQRSLCHLYCYIPTPPVILHIIDIPYPSLLVTSIGDANRQIGNTNRTNHLIPTF